MRIASSFCISRYACRESMVLPWKTSTRSLVAPWRQPPSVNVTAPVLGSTQRTTLPAWAVSDSRSIAVMNISLSMLALRLCRQAGSEMVAGRCSAEVCFSVRTGQVRTMVRRVLAVVSQGILHLCSGIQPGIHGNPLLCRPVNLHQRQQPLAFNIKPLVVRHHQVRQQVNVDEGYRNGGPFGFVTGFTGEPAGTYEQALVALPKSANEATDGVGAHAAVSVLHFSFDAGLSQPQAIGRGQHVYAAVWPSGGNTSLVAHGAEQGSGEIFHFLRVEALYLVLDELMATGDDLLSQNLELGFRCLSLIRGGWLCHRFAGQSVLNFADDRIRQGEHRQNRAQAVSGGLAELVSGYAAQPLHFADMLELTYLFGLGAELILAQVFANQVFPVLLAVGNEGVALLELVPELANHGECVGYAPRLRVTEVLYIGLLQRFGAVVVTQVSQAIPANGYAVVVFEVVKVPAAVAGTNHPAVFHLFSSSIIIGPFDSSKPKAAVDLFPHF